MAALDLKVVSLSFLAFMIMRRLLLQFGRLNCGCDHDAISGACFGSLLQNLCGQLNITSAYKGVGMKAAGYVWASSGALDWTQVHLGRGQLS